MKRRNLNENLSENDFRYERKFVVPELSSKEIENVIKLNSYCFSEIFYKRKVNSIYFDRKDMENYVDNLRGISSRIKIRIRWYGETFPIIKNPVLEIKIREGELGRKMSFNLETFDLNKKFTHLQMFRIFENSRLPKWIQEELRHYFPCMIVSYTRKYFQSKNKKFRITLDTDISFLKMRHNSFKEKLMEKHINIVELKYSFEDDFDASHVSNQFPFRLTASSKYVYGINLFDF